ncbi:TPA: hypothetical protein TZ293_000146 [Streptococcus suis]|nr:hypothetical protein [Streptococcus suis]HEL2500891.1 hypothetical protein [Streptococcus suis]
MNVVKDLATIISIIVATITLAGVYYSDTEEVDKRKKIFLKNIAIIVTVTIFLWMFCIFLLGSYFQTDLLTVLSLVNPTLLFSILLFVVSFSTGLFIQSRTNFLSTIDNDEITFTRIINRLTIKKKMNRSKLWRFNQEYLNPFLKSVTLGTYLLLGVLSVVLLFINHLDNEIKQFPFQSQERFYLKNVSDNKIYSIDTETDFDVIMTSVKKVQNYYIVLKTMFIAYQ